MNAVEICPICEQVMKEHKVQDKDTGEIYIVFYCAACHTDYLADLEYGWIPIEPLWPYNLKGGWGSTCQ